MIFLEQVLFPSKIEETYLAIFGLQLPFIDYLTTLINSPY